MNFLALQQAIKQKSTAEKKSDEINAIAYFDNIDKQYSKMYNTVFGDSPCLIDAAFEMFDVVEFEEVSIPLSVKEVLEFI